MNGTVWIVITFMLLIGGYQKARQHEREHGYIPWGLPAWAWSLLWGLGLIIGAVLWVVATRLGKPPLAATPTQAPSFAGLPPSGYAPAGLPRFGAAPTGVGVPPGYFVPQGLETPGSSQPQIGGPTSTQATPAAGVASAPSLPVAPAGWYPNPGAAGQRWWDGSQWTEHTAS